MGYNALRSTLLTNGAAYSRN